MGIRSCPAGAHGAEGVETMSCHGEPVGAYRQGPRGDDGRPYTVRASDGNLPGEVLHAGLQDLPVHP